MTEPADGVDVAIDRDPASPPGPPAGDAGNPYFSDPLHRAYHYAGALLDYAGQYRDATGRIPSGPDLAEMADRAGSEALGTGWAGHPVLAGATATSATGTTHPAIGDPQPPASGPAPEANGKQHLAQMFHWEVTQSGRP